MPDRELMSAQALEQNIEAMTDALAAIGRRNDELALIGIRTRGAILAQRLHRRLQERTGKPIPLGILDITLYRDDLSQLAATPLVQKTQLDFDVTGRTILLLDDVLYTGRTVRCALSEILDFGRPRAIRLAILVDRGGREIPIQADLAMLTIDAAENEVVHVKFTESDGQDRVVLTDRHAAIQPAS